MTKNKTLSSRAVTLHTPAHTPARTLRLISSHTAAGGRLRVAIATRGSQAINEPFGRAQAFSIYDITADASELVAIVEFPMVCRPCAAANYNPDDCPDRIESRIDALTGCHVLFTQAIGDNAAACAIRNNIHPLVIARDETVAALIHRCQAMLVGNPPPWVRRIIAATAGASADGGAVR